MINLTWLWTLVIVLGVDILFTAVLLVPVVLLAIFRPAAFAVLKRNFVGYFSNPTGYVFLVLFVLMTSFAAFWPHEFFTNNLANLDQLNIWIPLIMLVFIPAITMSVWAEEQQQGTDELLLTLPGTDWEIVLGKFVAAAAIYTASLLFSFLTNFVVLNALSLGDVDLGMFATTYLGYWFLGLAMISFGMCASFLTSNLTVAFILGVLFNLPLAFLGSAQWSQTGHVVPSPEWAESLEPLPDEGLYRVREPFRCCERACRTYEADLLVQLGYDADGRPLLFVPEWTDAGLAIPELGLAIDEDRLQRLAPLTVAEYDDEPDSDFLH